MWLPWKVTLWCIACINIVAQPPSAFLDVRAGGTSVPGHHVDEFVLTSSGPIKRMTAYMQFGPMNQVSSAGSLSVFPTQLTPDEAERDSHLTFDISNARILSQEEHSFLVRAEVEFDSALAPGTFSVGRAVVADGHTPYSMHVFGSFEDGTQFGTSAIFVPEPGVIPLCLLAAVLAGGFRVFGRRRS